jgi:hypothetical protein
MFTPFKPCVPLQELHPHQALCLLNRWTRGSHLAKEDTTVYHALKEHQLKLWAEEFPPVRIIRRPSRLMKALAFQLERDCMDLQPLNIGSGHHDALAFSPNHTHWKTLHQAVHEGVPVSLPQEVFNRRLETYQQELQAYEDQLREHQEHQDKFDQAALHLRSNLDKLDRVLEALQEDKTSPLQKWARATRHDFLPRLTDRQVAVIGRMFRRFEVPGFPDIPPFPYPPVPPQPPVDHHLIPLEEADPEDYPALQAALQWASGVQGSLVTPSTLNQALQRLQLKVKREAMIVLRRKAEEAFQRILTEDLNPEEVYTLLTALPLDYESVGIRAFVEDGVRVHGAFTDWYRTRLNLRAHWLIEYESSIDEGVILHVPLSDSPLVDTLPHTTDACFGGGISRDERRFYPAVDLALLLGWELEDFPFRLEDQHPPSDTTHLSACKSDSLATATGL